MKNLPRVAAVVLMASVIFGPAVVLARSGGHAPDIRVPEAHQPRDVKVPDVKVPDVKIPDVKVPEVRVPQAAVRDNAPTGGAADPRTPPTPPAEGLRRHRAGCRSPRAMSSRTWSPPAASIRVPPS